MIRQTGGFAVGATPYDIDAGTTYDVDYCLTPNATIPGTGSNNHVGVTWGDHYDAGYSPKSLTSKHGGDPVNFSPFGFYGNPLPDDDGKVPIGAIYAG